MKDQFVKTFYVSKIQMALQPTGGTDGTNSVTLPKFPNCNLGLVAKTCLLISCFKSRKEATHIFVILLYLTSLCELCR